MSMFGTHIGPSENHTQPPTECLNRQINELSAISSRLERVARDFAVNDDMKESTERLEKRVKDVECLADMSRERQAKGEDRWQRLFDEMERRIQKLEYQVNHHQPHPPAS